MRIQNLILAILFIVGSAASCLTLYQNGPQDKCAISSTSDAKEFCLDADESKASRFIDYANPKDAARIYDSKLKKELAVKPQNLERLCRLLNNFGVSLYLLAETQSKEKFVALARSSLKYFHQAGLIAQKIGDNPKYVAASYNEYLIHLSLNEEFKAQRLISNSSQFRKKMRPQLENGLIP